jgi:hypothetical protein
MPSPVQVGHRDRGKRHLSVDVDAKYVRKEDGSVKDVMLLVYWVFCCIANEKKSS